MSRLLDLFLSPLWRLLVWLDVQINIHLFRGRAETISSRCWRGSRKRAGCRWLCAQLDKVQPRHCELAYWSARAKNPNLPEPD